MKLLFKRAVAAAILAFGLASMISQAQAETVVRFIVAEYSSKSGPHYERVAAAFEKDNPGIDIQVEVVPWNILLQRLTTDIAAGTAPDISIIGTRWLLDFASQGVAEPIDSYLTPEFKDKLIGTFMGPGTIDGKIMGLPVAASARAMVINKGLYNKVGAKAPKTWDELVEASRKISAMKDTFGFGLQGKEIETDAYFYYALWTHGGDIFTADGKSGLNSPAAIQAATLYKEMLDAGLTQPSPTNYTREDVFNMFKQGKLGTIFTFPMLIPQLKEEAKDIEYEVLPFPVKTTKATYGVTDTMMLFSNSKVKDAAWKFMEYSFQTKWRSEFTLGEGFLPVTKGVAADKYFTSDMDIKGFADGLPYAKFAPTVENWEEMADVTVQALQKIYLGQATPEEAMNDAANRVNKILGK